MKIIKKPIDNSEKKNHSRPHICWGSLLCTNLTQPTGALDSKIGEEIMKVFLKLNNQGKTVIIVTHDERVAQMCGRTIHIKDGVVQ